MGQRTLSEEDVDAIAARVIQLLAMRISSSVPAREVLQPVRKTEPAPPLAAKLAFSLKELSAELGISKVSIYRLEARGLLKSLRYLRTKIYTRKEVERFLAEKDE